MATIAANLKLQPAEATEYFRGKGLQVTWSWTDMTREAHAAAFTVAKATTLDVLSAIRTEVDKAIGEGQTFEAFKKALRPKLQDLGWWGRQEVLDGETGELTTAQLGSNRRLRTIFQTNVQTAYMAGRYKRYLADVENRPYWRYVAILDGRTRPAHRALHGKVWRWDDPIWQVIWPPNGWGCRCRVQALTEAEFRALGVALEDGSQAISTIRVPVNKDGDTVDVQVVRYMDERGQPRTFRPDPGWDYNPGVASQANLDRVMTGKLEQAAPAISQATVRDMAGQPQFGQWLQAPTGNWPLVSVPPADAQSIGAASRIGTVAGAVVRAAGAASVDYAGAQLVIEQGILVRSAGQLIYVLRQGETVSIVRAQASGDSLAVVSVERLTLEQAMADADIAAAL